MFSTSLSVSRSLSELWFSVESHKRSRYSGEVSGQLRWLAERDRCQKFLGNSINKIKWYCLEVEAIAEQLDSQGIYPSEMIVSQYIDKPGYFRYKEVRNALKNFQVEEEVRIQESGVWREIEWGFKPQPISGNL